MLLNSATVSTGRLSILCCLYCTKSLTTGTFLIVFLLEGVLYCMEIDYFSLRDWVLGSFNRMGWSHFSSFSFMLR